MTVPALWTKHRRLATGIASEYRIPGFGSDDVRQEAWIALWEASRSHDPQLGEFKGWARRVIHARLTDLLRKQTLSGRYRQHRKPITVPLGEYDAPAPDPGRQLQDLVERLPSLTALEREAIAARLNGSYSSRNRRLENALQSARRKLAP